MGDGGGVWSAIHWWDKWQLRVLVLSSLGVQWFLLLAAPMRKYTIPRCFRTFIWLAYIGSDALAIYALATLFNRHARGTPTSGGGGNGDAAAAALPSSSRALEVLWAPVLLIHLGGQEEITAYNIEDNELWTRHTVTLVSQVTVAVYAFCKSWWPPGSSSSSSGGDPRLLASAILLFVIGVLSFSEKPWAQRRACIDRMAAVSSKVRRRRTAREPPAATITAVFTKLVNQWWGRMPRTMHKMKGNEVLSEEDKLHIILSDMSLLATSTDVMKQQQQQQQQLMITKQEEEEEEEDLTKLVTEEKEAAGGGGGGGGGILRPLGPRAEMELKPWLRRAFGLIYTRVNVATTPTYLAYHMLLVPSLHVAAITLFAASDKRRFDAGDVTITYAILAVTAALDVLAETIRQLLYRAMSAAGIPALCETLPQYSLLSAALRRARPGTGWLLRCAARLGLEEVLMMCRRDESLYGRVVGFVMADIVSGAGSGGLDLGSYRSFTDGNWALSADLPGRCGPMIRRTLQESSFDESVLVWHVATDLCFHRSGPPPAADAWKRECTRAISNYMAHLLSFRPDMLMTGSRRHLLTEAMEEVELIIKDKPPPVDDAALLEIIQKAAGSRSTSMSELPHHEYPLIHDACRLSDELMEMQQQGGGWEVMYRVWLGMLCYSASMCRGYLHAKSLGEGGEFLSFVWLVLSLKGAKTLADKLQMPPEPARSCPGTTTGQ